MYLREIARFRPLTAREEKKVALRLRSGDPQAFRTLVESNLRFVVAMARKYAGSGYPLHELINEGNLGLIEAARRFDPDRDVRFVTYAGWWIRQAILAAIAHYGQVFSIPPRLRHEAYRLENRIRRLTQELGRRPSLEEMSSRFEMTESDIRKLMSTSPGEISLSSPLGADGDLELEDVVGDSRASQDRELMAQSFHRQLEELLSQLDEKERAIVEGRFGLTGQDSMTLRELGERLRLSPERIRQLEARALEKLRRSRRAQQLRGYLN